MPASTVREAAAARDTGPVALIWHRKSHFAAVLPASVDVESFLGTAAGALYTNPRLMEAAQANPDSLIVALMECASLGHLPGSDDYYLTPRKDKGKPKILGIEGYRGVIERMYRSGAVARVVVREVCEDDKFEYVEGVDDKPRHVFGGQGGTGASFFGKGAPPRGEMVGVYAWAELATGAISRVVLLTRDDVHAAREAGGWRPDDPYSPWNRADGGKDHPEFTGRSMWWKTAAKRLEPWVPTSAEYRREQLRASASAASLAPARTPPAVPSGDRDVVDAEIIDDDTARPAIPPQPAPAPAAAAISDEQATAMTAGFRALGVTRRADRLALVTSWIDRDVTSARDLSAAEADTVLARLRGAVADMRAEENDTEGDQPDDGA